MESTDTASKSGIYKSQTHFKRQSGSTAVEYGLIIGLIALGLVGLLSQIGGDLNEPLNCSRDVINGQDETGMCK